MSGPTQARRTTASTSRIRYVCLSLVSRPSLICAYQFFITSTSGNGPVKNLIGKAIAERVLSAARSGKKFKVRHDVFAKAEPI
jgi:hypothetical protein